MCDFTISLDEDKPIMTVVIESPISGFHPHFVCWFIKYENRMWYHSFSLYSNLFDNDKIKKMNERISGKRYRFETSIVDVNMETRRTVERLIKKFGLRESDLNEIRAGLKPIERKLFEDIYKRENN